MNIHVYHDVDTAVYIYCTQGNITYELIGDFIAQQFFQINPYNGDVSVRRHLTTDRSQSESYQVFSINHDLSENIMVILVMQKKILPFKDSIANIMQSCLHGPA